MYQLCMVFAAKIYIGSTRISISALAGPTMAVRTLRFQYRQYRALGHSVTWGNCPRFTQTQMPAHIYLAFNVHKDHVMKHAHTHTYIYKQMYTSSTAQGGGGSFKDRKLIGDVGCCESRMVERSHWWTDRWLRSPLSLSLSLAIYLSIYLAI